LDDKQQQQDRKDIVSKEPINQIGITVKRSQRKTQTIEAWFLKVRGLHPNKHTVPQLTLQISITLSNQTQKRFGYSINSTTILPQIVTNSNSNQP